MIQDREALALTEYRPQGMGHILKLCAITTAGMVLVSAGGSVLFAAPLALATIYGMFRGASKAQDPNWCEARDELWNYKLSPKHRSIADDYLDWCNEWGTHTVNRIIEPMIGNCAIANFTKDKKHPYYGLRGVLIYDHDDDDLPPLTPWDYVNFRLEERLSILQKQETDTVEVDAQTLPLNDIIAPSNVTAHPELAQQFLLSLTAAPLQPVILAGLPGSGKGILAAMALSFGVLKHGLRFWVFNPKAKLSEAGYWVRAEKHYLKDRLQDDPDLFSDLMDVLEEFATEGTRRNSQPGEHPPFVLLLEEVNALTGLLTPKQKQRFKSKIIALASLLRGCNMALWLSGQSITLEDLGITGKSNRAMFTAIAAIGPEREAVNNLCQPLGIPFEPAQLQPTERYWLTATGCYTALPCPQNIPQYSDWSQVPNLVDLRPGALPPDSEKSLGEVEPLLADLEPQELAIQPNPIATKLKELQTVLKLRDEDVAEIHTQQLENSYKLSAPDEFELTSQRESSQLELDVPLKDLMHYLSNKGGKLPIVAIKQNWGKNRGLNSEAIDELLIELIDLKRIESFCPPNTKAEWVKLVGLG